MVPARLWPGNEFGLYDMELDLDYPLRIALKDRPEVGDVLDDEVVVILRRRSVPPQARPRRRIASGPYTILVISRKQAEYIFGKWDYMDQDWQIPYFPEGKLALSK